MDFSVFGDLYIRSHGAEIVRLEQSCTPELRLIRGWFKGKVQGKVTVGSGLLRINYVTLSGPQLPR